MTRVRLRSRVRKLLNHRPTALRERRERATVKRFHRLYYNNPGRTWKDTRWLDVPVFKCPLDLWIYQELLTETRPELVIETGTFAGGSALYLASCMDMLGSGRVITIDLHERDGLPPHDRITYVTGSSTDAQVVEQVRRAAETASSVVVILDSDHSRDHVLAELRAYAPFVTPGSYLLVEDTNINGRPIEPHLGPGPHEALEVFLREDSRFVRDESREKFFMSFNPGGFLRRLDERA
jgi:cephalosporin hydroxylase